MQLCRCPRVFCDGQPCLPVGTSDVPSQGTVKIFCPKCEDIYYPRSEYQCSIDGAYFGTTSAHLLLLTYPAYRPALSSEVYTPKIFGFKLHPTAYANRDQGQGNARSNSKRLTARGAAGGNAGQGQSSKSKGNRAAGMDGK